MEQKVCFSKKARYYFRKRKNCSSTQDLSWTDKRQFDDVLKFGVLELLRRSEVKLGRVPVFIQNVVIYHIQWYFRQLKNREDRILFLSERERKNFIDLLKKCFNYIDPNVFFEFTCPGLGKVGLTEISLFLLNSSKNSSVGLISYADNLAHPKEIRLMLLVREEADAIRFYLGEREVNPISVGYAKNTFCGASLSYWCIAWLALADQQNKKLSVTVNGQICPFLIGNSYVKKVELPEAIASFSPDQNCNAEKNSRYANCWLISDRDCQADDNGEHFYRYLKNNGVGVNAWFLLSKNSHDWKRLEEEGFKLISYGSRQHKEALKSCSLLISSHADEYVINAFGDQTNRKVPFVFLQHGVIKDDLSLWLNPKKIRLMVTSTKEERKSIIDSQSKYQYTEREVILTGLPRYDALNSQRSPQKIIVVMPTWRNSLVGNLIKGTTRSLNKNFMNSDYAKKWSHFLASQNLLKLLRVYGYRLQFFPHAYIQPYIKYFNLPKYIEICTHRTHRFQEVIGSAAIMITDYSSAAFDMVYLEKEVIYYQFDKGDIFKNNAHTYQKGYFEYSRDGFGPVIAKEDELLNYLEASIIRNCSSEEQYLDRMQHVFPLKDGRCCERIYNILKILKSE
ncbi:MAG: CDP-glycerol glycerophosphotransferase family protein [Parasutterella excrementihominis]|uniref:CDP-glycerol glycerophosphotransferase family protein n=1 Tax=Parasutterella excrementihominis TaxID=487175 RepID=UPI00399BF062